MKPDIMAFMAATYETALNAGVPIISTETAAKILAVTCVHGNNEFMCHSDKFKVEIDYIQRRFGIQGGEVPSSEIAPLIRHYIHQLELYERRNPEDRYPDWALDLFKNRYGIKLIN